MMSGHTVMINALKLAGLLFQLLSFPRRYMAWGVVFILFCRFVGPEVTGTSVISLDEKVEHVSRLWKMFCSLYCFEL